MRHNILVELSALIIASLFVHEAHALTRQEQLNLSRAFNLATSGTPEELRQAVNQGVNFNVETHLNFNDDGEFESIEDLGDYDEYYFDTATPLHAAASRNYNPESIRFLLSLGLDVNALAAAGNTIFETPLTCAVRNKNNI